MQSLAPDAPSPAQTASVLVIEDHPDGRESMRMLLEVLGFRVEVAGDGGRGVAKALAVRPDYALVDIGLPVLDGYEVARRVRAGLGASVVLIALTGYGQPGDRDRAFAAGFDYHVTKPADLGVLTRLLNTAEPAGTAPGAARGLPAGVSPAEVVR